MEKVGCRKLFLRCDKAVACARYQGFSLFELLVVLIVIGLLISLGHGYYFSPVDESKSSVVKFQASTFSRAVSNLNASSIASGKTKIVYLNEVPIYLNEYGWPANASGKRSPLVKNQTKEECQQLWHAIFSNASGSSTIESANNKNVDFYISLKEKDICRYQWAQKKDGFDFFDYNLRTGQVLISHP